MKRTVLLSLFIISISFAQHQSETLVSEDFLLKLKDGNTRFLSGTVSEKKYLDDVKSTSNGQHPYAVILTCADSRLSPEIIFDESIGKLFVIRVAGNVVDPAILGSIEYAVEHLGTGYVMVLGHTSCGAVKAAIDGGDFTPAISQLAALIQPAVEKVKELKQLNEKIYSDVTKENVKLQIQNIKSESKLIHEFIDSGKLKISGGVYDITSGQIDFFEH